jgi:hypothetical protein
MLEFGCGSVGSDEMAKVTRYVSTIQCPRFLEYVPFSTCRMFVHFFNCKKGRRRSASHGP